MAGCEDSGEDRPGGFRRQRCGIGPVSYTHLDVYKRQGIQISTRMSESALGFEAAVTRQNGGRSARGFPEAGVNVPPVKTSALVIVVCGR